MHPNRRRHQHSTEESFLHLSCPRSPSLPLPSLFPSLLPKAVPRGKQKDMTGLANSELPYKLRSLVRGGLCKLKPLSSHPIARLETRVRRVALPLRVCRGCSLSRRRVCGVVGWDDDGRSPRVVKIKHKNGGFAWPDGWFVGVL